jgi:hypothetical protein
LRHLLDNGSDGERVIEFALAQDQPDVRLFDLVADAVENSHSAFEQYHALGASYEMLDYLDPGQRRQLRRTLESVVGNPRYESTKTPAGGD